MSEIPKYPRHLTGKERMAVYSKAVKDLIESMGIPDKRAQATKGELAELIAVSTVSMTWDIERLKALEEAVAELRAAKLPKPRVRVQAGSNA